MGNFVGSSTSYKNVASLPERQIFEKNLKLLSTWKFHSLRKIIHTDFSSNGKD